jgi:hypothetical protein
MRLMVQHGVKAPGIAARRELPVYAALNAKGAFDDEVLEIVRHERIVSRRRIHLYNTPACRRGAHGIVALAGAKKRDGHRSATGIFHCGTAACIVSKKIMERTRHIVSHVGISTGAKLSGPPSYPGRQYADGRDRPGHHASHIIKLAQCAPYFNAGHPVTRSRRGGRIHRS